MRAMVVLVSPQVDQWADFAEALECEGQVKVVKVQTGAEAVEAVRNKQTTAVVVDAVLSDMAGVALVRPLMAIDAMIHVALVSDQSTQDFHEATEGLGIMMQLPARPAGVHARQLLGRLRQLSGVL